MSDEDSLRGRKLLVISAGSNKKENLFHELKKLGIKIILIDKRLKSWASKYFHDYIETNTDSVDETIKVLREYYKKEKFEGAITFWEESVPLTARVCEEFGFPGNKYDDVMKLKNKSDFRKYSREFGLPTPKTMFIKSKDDLKKVLDQLTFPIVVKPVFGSSSEYVVRIDDPEKLDYEYEKIMTGIVTTDFAYLGTDLTAEEYIPGDEIDIDMIIQDGEIKYSTVGDNPPTIEPFFIETGWNYPSKLSREEQQKIFDFAKAALDKFQIKNSTIHFEAKLHNGGIYPIEINLRLGGDGLEKMIFSTWGINIVEYIAKNALGIKLKPVGLPETKAHVFGRYIIPTKTGTLTKVEIDPRLKDDKYLQDFLFDKKVGDHLRTPPIGYDYIGWVSVAAPTYEEAKQNCERLLSYIHYEIED